MKIKCNKRKVLARSCGGLVLLAGIACFLVVRTWSRTQVEFNIHMNKEAIYLSAYAEPPQFAIWLENARNGKLKQVFVTYRAGENDWVGKANVPIAIPHWSEVFCRADSEERNDCDGISGATPKDEYFRIRVEVPPGSEWIGWIEMNLAGDFNEYYPFFNRETLQEDEYSCGQPALLYRVEIKAEKGNRYTPELVGMSLQKEGANRLLQVDSTITTAKDVFDRIDIQVINPKPRLIDRYEVNVQLNDNQ